MNANYVTKNLMVGSAPNKEDLDFVGNVADVLVLCAKQNQLPGCQKEGLEILRVPLTDDVLTHSELVRALAAGDKVAARLKEGKRVMSTCMAGINRSALIAGLAMRKRGSSYKTTLETIRDARGPEALFNDYFRKVLRNVSSKA